ncbi:EF-hand [Hesseltinella vesiculosa]|uniref:EF-hand n=1 Tax=Hesseltinella vesiculosa TaxID=101127 RepID=A0A1X2GTR0_9FUNG|nr:EF-hand [Hesseltinella vesiculosa]
MTDDENDNWLMAIDNTAYDSDDDQSEVSRSYSIVSLSDSSTSSIASDNGSRDSEAQFSSQTVYARAQRLLRHFKEWPDDQEPETKNLLQLLHAIAENQSRKEGFIHRGITCNKCNVSPIRGIRYKCANCVDFDLCDTCEALNEHIHTHTFLKIRIPIPPLANPRSAILPPFYPGKNDSLTLSASVLHDLETHSHFDQVELEALFAQYKALSVVETSQGGIPRKTFEQCLGPLGMEKNLITERIFQFFDRNRDGVITFPELVQGLSILSKGNLDEKIQYAFQGYDLDEDGYISREELYWMFKAYFYLSMELVRDVVSALEDDMMDNYDFPAGQPVSAAFNVPIPQSNVNQSASDATVSSDEDEPYHDDSQPISPLDGQPSYESASNEKSSTASSSAPASKYPEKQDYFSTVTAQEEASPASLTDPPSQPESQVAAALSTRYESPRSGALTHVDPPSPEPTVTYRASGTSPTVPVPLSSAASKRVKTMARQHWEEKFPIMETMAQDAIQEMVDKTFRNIDTKREGYISFDEFKQCVQADLSIVSWFEALGTVF